MCGSLAKKGSHKERDEGSVRVCSPSDAVTMLPSIRLQFQDDEDDDDFHCYSATGSDATQPRSCSFGSPQLTASSTRCDMFAEADDRFVQVPRSAVCTPQTAGQEIHFVFHQPAAATCADNEEEDSGNQADTLRVHVDSGCASEIGPRSKQEDNLINSERDCVWGVFDGHRGSEAASYTSNFFLEHLDTSAPCPAHEMAGCLQHLEASMLANRIGLSCGTTACVARMIPQTHMMYVANLGDSRAALFSTSSATTKILTEDHRVDSAREVERLKREGADVSCGRFGGELCLSRGLGDFDLKAATPGLSCMADVYAAKVERGDILIMATDGVWDVVDLEEAAAVVVPLQKLSLDPTGTPRGMAGQAAQALVQHAIRNKRSSDNCTAVVVFFG